MVNWVEKIEKSMSDCPSAEELEKEKLESELDRSLPSKYPNAQE